MASTQSSLKSILSAGVPTTSLPSIIQALAANSPTSAVKAACTTILANSNNPGVVKDMAMKMAEIQGLPVAVVNLLPSLTAATTRSRSSMRSRRSRPLSARAPGGSASDLDQALVNPPDLASRRKGWLLRPLPMATPTRFEGGSDLRESQSIGRAAW